MSNQFNALFIGVRSKALSLFGAGPISVISSPYLNVAAAGEKYRSLFHRSEYGSP